MAERLPPRQPKGPWGNLSKNLALWVLLGLLALALFQLVGNQRSGSEELSYTQFSQQLDARNVASVQIYDGKYVEGEFRSPVTMASRSIKNFKVLLPVADSEEFVKRLEAAGVVIKAKEQRGALTTILLGALPWVLVFGVWIYFIRTMQAGGSRAFAFGKSKAKLLAGDTPKVTFADVAGADEAKV
ncbi:MAG TPA: ATP-dependent metallopeptidase FtsH/Yme1/Tma family protein, partial [Gemmatimonadales bacterium]|nr:ATP-dependent metallopeptidase FtsH/Yme1/Tma family protein [Gemmatimonadales bacterium]